MEDQHNIEVAPQIMSGQERPQPHDLATERAVLSAMLREPQMCVDVVIEHLGEHPEMFYSHIHREIFDAIIEINHDHELKVDALVLAHKLFSRGTLDRVGGEVFLAELYNAVATTAPLESWCKILRDYYCLRQMIGVCSESLQKCYDPESTAINIIEDIEKSVFNVRHATERSQMVDIRTGLIEEFNRIQDVLNKKVKPGIHTGFPRLDALTGGLKPGEMFVLAARPSIGKTAIALNIVRNIALGKDRAKVLLFSLEMTAGQITRRLMCTEADVPESSFLDGTFRPADFSKLTQAVTALRSACIFIDPTPALTVGALQARARRMKMMHDIDVVVIDYLQLMKAGGRVESRQNEVAEISSGIKQLAKDLNVPVLVLAQLNRDIEKGTDPNALPKLSHLRESGAIEQDADVIVFLYRDDAYNKSEDNPKKGIAEIIIGKQRNGPTGTVELSYLNKYTAFENLANIAPSEEMPSGTMPE